MKRSRGQSFFRFATVAVFGVAAGIALLVSVPVSASSVPADAVPPPENFSTERTDYFSVSAETSASARAAGTLAREVENYFRKNAHRWRAVLPPQGVRANVELFSRAGVFRIERDSESGDITLYISENPDPRDVERSARILRREFARALLMQALVARSVLNVPRRTTEGFDYNRANLLLAVLEKRGGLNLGNCDAYINIIGGLRLDEPAADLAMVLAVASSFRDKALDDGLAAIGEVGLTGEVRAVTALEQRLTEAARNGFTRAIIPRHGTQNVRTPESMELYRVRNIREAIEFTL